MRFDALRLALLASALCLAACRSQYAPDPILPTDVVRDEATAIALAQPCLDHFGAGKPVGARLVADEWWTGKGEVLVNIRKSDGEVTACMANRMIGHF